MNNLRWWTTCLILWLAFLFNTERVIERLSEELHVKAINITYSYTYIFILITVLFTLLIPTLRRLSLGILLSIFIILYLLLTLYYYREGILTELPRTITQISAIILTALMTRQLNRNLKEFENTVNEITFERIGQYPDLFSEKQGTMYNEVKRARRYERPVSIVALKFDEHNIKQAIPKIIEEVHQKMIQRYVISGIARTLEDNTQDFDTIALRDDCFLIVLPEIDSQNVTSIAQNLQQIIKEQMNISIKVGMASYPENAITFDRLADLAMENTNKPQQQNV